jgi:hypothetical protein
MEPGPPPKFWGYESLLDQLIATVIRHVESRVGSGQWETIFFTLRNAEQPSYEVRASLSGKPDEHLGPSSTVDQIVGSLVNLLHESPEEAWTRLSIETHSKGSIIELDE